MSAWSAERDRLLELTVGDLLAPALAAEVDESVRSGRDPVGQDAQLEPRGGHPAIGVEQVRHTEFELAERDPHRAAPRKADDTVPELRAVTFSSTDSSKLGGFRRATPLEQNRAKPLKSVDVVPGPAGQLQRAPPTVLRQVKIARTECGQGTEVGGRHEHRHRPRVPAPRRASGPAARAASSSSSLNVSATVAPPSACQYFLQTLVA